jgi:uncharacterized phage protein (predicted DNA packaging)
MWEEVRDYLRVDDTEQSSVEALIGAAQSYLINAGVTANGSDPLYRLGVKMLVSHWYENREVVGNANQLTYGIQAIITQLKFGGD